MINKKYKWGYMAVILICIAAMAAGAKYDYIITDKLYNPQSFFGMIFEAMAWIPIYAFIPFWGTAMMIRSKNNMASFSFGIFMLIASCSGFSYMICDHFVDRGFMAKVNPYMCGIIGGLASAVIFMLMRSFKRSVVRKIQILCSFGFIYMIGYISIILVLKKIFGRDRYEDIISGGEYVFAHWFKPVFFSSGSSFPSGHTAAAMGMLLLLLLPFIFKPFKDLKMPLFVGSYLYAFLTAFSRMIMGRHFLSDTAAAILIMTVLFMCLTPGFEKSYRTIFLKE